MKITDLRIKVALGYALGVISALSLSSNATDSEVTAELNKPAAGIHCPAYENKEGTEFTCAHVDEEGEVVKTTTFLVIMGSNGDLVPVSADGAMEKDKDSGSTIVADDATGGSADNGVLEPVDGVAEPDVVALDNSANGGNDKPSADETVEGTEEEGVTSYAYWTHKFKNAYQASVATISDSYHYLFDDVALVEEEPASADTPDIVLSVEELEAEPVPEDVPQEEAVDVTALDEEKEVEVKDPLPNWKAYAKLVYSQEDPYEFYKNEAHWLAMNMVFEARNQDTIGMHAVADTTMKRLDIHLRGDKNIHDVVTDPAEFSWYGDRIIDVLTMKELPLYAESLYFAEIMLSDYMDGKWSPMLASEQCPAGATHYHKTDIVPDWQETMELDCGVIGLHHFWYGK